MKPEPSSTRACRGRTKPVFVELFGLIVSLEPRLPNGSVKERIPSLPFTPFSRGTPVPSTGIRASR